MRNRLSIYLALLLIFSAYTAYADIEIYSIEIAPGRSKIFKYKPNKEVTVAMAIARAGYAGKYCSFLGTISEEEDARQENLKATALKKLGLTQEEYGALNES